MSIRVLENIQYNLDYPECMLDVFIPGSNAIGKVILFVHGGGFVKGSRHDWTAVARYFCEQGYTTATADYRLAPQWQFPASVIDVRLAVNFLRSNAARFQFSADALAAVGSSAGGYLVLMLACSLPEDKVFTSPERQAQNTRPQVVIAEAPVTDFQRLTEYPWVADYLGSIESENPQLYRTASITTRISGSEPPTLLLHGTEDEVIPFAHSEILVNLMRQKGVQAELIELLQAKHGFGYGISTKTQQEANRLILTFLQRHL